MPRPRSRVRYQVGATNPSARAAVPSVEPWTAGEMFVSPHVEERRRGFAILCGADHTRASPLTAHLLASRLAETDLALRAQIVQALADYYELRDRQYRFGPEVRALVTGALRSFDRPQTLALLELYHAGRAGAVRLRPEGLLRVFERIPGASGLLTRLGGDRGLSVSLRQAAIEMIGHVGYVDARPALEGLLLRIEGRRAGQLTMLFAPSDWPEDEALLPALKETLRLLDEND